MTEAHRCKQLSGQVEPVICECGKCYAIITGSNNNNNNNTRLVERRGAIALEALADRSSQLASNRREKMSF